MEMFELHTANQVLKVEAFTLSGHRLFRITFPDKTLPLVITRATHANGGLFWTSVPEGRQALSEQTGLFIESYYKIKK